jgi:hypothetical protein
MRTVIGALRDYFRECFIYPNEAEGMDNMHHIMAGKEGLAKEN